MVGVDAAKLPATHQVLHGHAAPIQELLTGPERQLINLRDVEDVRTIIVANGPFRVRIKLVQTPKVECRKTAVSVRQGLRQGVRHQEGQSTAGALLKASLNAIVLVRPRGVEIVRHTAELRVWQGGGGTERMAIIICDSGRTAEH